MGKTRKRPGSKFALGGNFGLAVSGFALAAVGFAAGTAFGFREGLDASFYIDAAPRGSVAVANLNSLAKGEPQAAAMLLENEVDQSLAFHSMLLDAWWAPLYRRGWLPADPAHAEELIRQVATYRYAHKNPIPETVFDQVPKGEETLAPQYKEMAAGLRGFRHRVEAVVDQYADRQTHAQ